MKNVILLVGHEPMLMKEIPGFPGVLEDWDVRFAPTAQEALTVLGQQPCEAVVSDLRLPGSTGPQFLDTVMEQHPSVHRFIIADLADKETMLKVVANAHHFISKPCDDRVLMVALERANKVDLLFGSDEVKRALSRIKKMPSPPSIYFQVVKELQSPTASMESVGAIISRDQAITVKLLQMVNSATFGLQRSVSSSAEAVLYLGIETTKSLVLLAHTFSYFDKSSVGGFSIDMLWAHSLFTARLARAVSRAENAPPDIREQAFTGGLLHDLGKLLIVANEPENFKRMTEIRQSKQLSTAEAEKEVFGVTHGELGAWLSAIWGLPLAIVEAIALHHYPAKFISEGFCPLTAVHIANFVAHEMQPDQQGNALSQIDIRYLDHLGLQDRLDVWRQLGQALVQGED